MFRHALMIALAGLSFASGARAASGSPPPPAASSSGAAPSGNVASPAERTRIKALMQYQKDLVSVLALRGDAEHLLGAALLARPLPNQPEGLSYHDLITRAAKAPNAGPGITWARLADCDAEADACPSADALTQLEQQAAGNAAVWMLALDEAAIRNDSHAMRAYLAKAAAAGTYDDYFGVALQGVASSVGTLPPLPDTMAGAQQGDPTTAAGVELLIAFGVANQQPRPSLQPLLQLCAAEDASRDEALKGDCLKVAHDLEWGSSPMGRAVGLHITGELDPSARAGAREQARDLAWQMQNYGELGIKAFTDDKLAQQLLDAARNGGTELSLVVSTLRANGIATEAPAGWQAAEPEALPAPGSSAAQPAAGSSAALPVPGSSAAQPAAGSSTALPGSSAAQPAAGSSAALPVPGSSAAQPAAGSSTAQPAASSSAGRAQ